MADVPVDKVLFQTTFQGAAHHDETLIYAVYSAARAAAAVPGRQPLAQRYLYPTDLVVGIIGAEGGGQIDAHQGAFSRAWN